jgi:hypothetical protein
VHGQQQRVYKTVKELNISELSDGKGINWLIPMNM